MNPLLNIANNAARKAGNIIVQALNRLDTINISQKRANDFVSDIDRKSEQQIIDIIQKAHPEHQIIAEESGLHEGLDECVWLIDPLDGTHNFIRGLPHFCISIAFQFKGKLQHALIYDPIRQEVFTASRGEGARLNDRRIRVGKNAKLSEALVSTGFPLDEERFLSFLPVFRQLIPQVSDIRCLGSAALDLAYVAANRLDGFLELGLKPWDIAAGALLVKEAGGLAGDWQGGENYLEKGDIIAGSPKIFTALMQIAGKMNLQKGEN